MADAYTIARPYAEAIYEMAKDSESFSEWEETLSLLASIAGDEQMARLLNNPRLEETRKQQLFHQIIGDYLSESGERLLNTLFTNNRVSFLPDILAIYRDLRRSAEGEVHAVLTSAFELSEEQEQDIIERLEKRLGRKVTIEKQVDESLLAGLVIRAGDWVIDGSVRGGLQQLRNRLQS